LYGDFMALGKMTQAIVGHVGIEVSNLSRSKRFYRRALGLSSVDRYRIP
jgi:catechol-2,3-dioxygenase